LPACYLGNSESTFWTVPHTLEGVNLVFSVISVLQIAVLVTTVYAFVHAAMQRPDAYTAAEKLTKPVWLVILGVAAALTFFLGVLGIAIAACAAGVYLVDVRPKLLDIQGKSR
jgi:4-amino-4-deoxy-L-arabinose transferase-like glycosyltransferase